MLDVFMSLGTPVDEKQEAFVHALEERLRSEGILTYSVGRNTFSSDAPLKTITNRLDTCVGTVVVALERFYFPSGIENPGGRRERAIGEIRLSTTWNQIEASMSYSRNLPLLVIVDERLRTDGLLESGYDWYVLRLNPIPSSLSTPEFNGVLASWKKKLESGQSEKSNSASEPSPKEIDELTIRELLMGMRPKQLWGFLSVMAALVIGAFALGTYLGPIVASLKHH
ncbi:MAG: hypothetical protein ABR975_06985 [Vulcanimicrobiaceae bacterium]